jgi:hypothetical protein
VSEPRLPLVGFSLPLTMLAWRVLCARLFYGNRGVVSGGAIVNVGPHSTIIVGGTFQANESPRGGAISNWGTTLYVERSRFITNFGYSLGGAIYNHGGLRLNCVQFPAGGPNRAPSGRDIANDGNLKECSSPDPVDVFANTPLTATCTRCATRMSGEGGGDGAGSGDLMSGVSEGEGGSGEALKEEVEGEEAGPEQGGEGSTRRVLQGISGEDYDDDDGAGTGDLMSGVDGGEGDSAEAVKGEVEGEEEAGPEQGEEGPARRLLGLGGRRLRTTA